MTVNHLKGYYTNDFFSKTYLVVRVQVVDLPSHLIPAT